MYCPKCGCENNDGANFCTSCGYNYTVGTIENAPKVKRNGKLIEKKKKPNGCLTALMVVIIIFGIVNQYGYPALLTTMVMAGLILIVAGICKLGTYINIFRIRL